MDGLFRFDLLPQQILKDTAGEEETSLLQHQQAGNHSKLR